jgi:hypothetical protein
VLQQGAGLGAIAVLGGACGKSTPKVLTCTDTTGLSPTDIQIREAVLQYVEVSAPDVSGRFATQVPALGTMPPQFRAAWPGSTRTPLATLPVEHPKLMQEKVEFTDPAAFTSLDAPEVVFCCLGTTIKKAGSREAASARAASEGACPTERLTWSIGCCRTCP